MASKTKSHVLGVRFTSIALAILSVWFVVAAAVGLPYGGYEEVAGFLKQPANLVAAGLLAVVGLWHMALGMEEVILDYIAKPGTKSFLLFLNGAACLVLAIAALYALYSLYSGA